MTAGWRVEISARARRDLRRLDPPVRERVYEALDRLVADPPAGDWEAMTVVVLRVLPRGRAYRD